MRSSLGAQAEDSVAKPSPGSTTFQISRGLKSIIFVMWMRYSQLLVLLLAWTLSRLPADCMGVQAENDGSQPPSTRSIVRRAFSFAATAPQHASRTSLREGATKPTLFRFRRQDRAASQPNPIPQTKAHVNGQTDPASDRPTPNASPNGKPQLPERSCVSPHGEPSRAPSYATLAGSLLPNLLTRRR